MGTLTDSLFSILMSWVRALVSAIWALFSSEKTTLLEFLGKHWIGVVVVLVGVGLVVDWVVWLIRWQPYHIWAIRIRRFLRMEDPQDEAQQETDDEDDMEARAKAAYDELEESPDTFWQDEEAQRANEDFEEEPVRTYVPERERRQQEQWMPLEQPVFDEEETRRMVEAADSVPDESLGAYPGMRYDSQAQQREMLGGTKRMSAVRAEGPGAAEVSRRRAEIDAWQQQMQEEARQKAQAERRAREQARADEIRMAAEAANQAAAPVQAEPEQEDPAMEQYRRELAEYKRQKAQYERDMEEYRRRKAAMQSDAPAREIAPVQAEPEPQEDPAMEQYRRELAEYERQKAQYDREMEEYRRQKAEYDAFVAQQEAARTEFAQENPRQTAARRRRAPGETAGEEAEPVTKLPAPPDWTSAQDEWTARHTALRQRQQKPGLLKSGAAKVAKMMETDDEEVTGITALPPRVDRHAAYKPAKKPVKK